MSVSCYIFMQPIREFGVVNIPGFVVQAHDGLDLLAYTDLQMLHGGNAAKGITNQRV